MVKVKICGVTNLDDAVVSVQAGADAIGFIFWEKSRRSITPGAAALISRELPPFVTTVGVFVNDSVERIKAVVKETGIGAVQLHGDESSDFCDRLGQSVRARIIKAFRIRDARDIRNLRDYDISACLLDTYREGVPGGTGETFDWDIAAEAVKTGRVILSGGLTPDNVEKAIEAVRPYAVDVSSGVESAPGKKDPGKISRFLEAVRRKG